MPLFVFVLLLWLPAWSEFNPSLPPGGDLDQFMLRIANRHQVLLPRSFYSKPMHAAEVIRFLTAADSLDSAGILTSQESFHLHDIRRIVSGGRHLLQFNKPEWETENYVNLSLLGDLSPSYREHADVGMRGVIGPGLRGASGKISYFSEVRVWTEYRSDTAFPVSSYQPFDGIPYNLNGRVKTSSIRSSDIFRGGVVYSGKRIDLETAVDYLRIGPALRNPLTLSGEGSPVTYVRVRMDLAAFEYVHAFGLLRAQKNREKYFYVHRLDFPLFGNRVQLGLNEVIINGSTAESAQEDSLKKELYGEKRGLEWVYMIPFVPYKFAEHYAGDRDNAALSFDCEIFLPREFRWYGEFFLDDIASPLTLFSDDFGNKWALTAGAQYFGVLFGRDLQVNLEYTRIEPWVYTHFNGGSHSYTHYGRSLGSDLGPDSDELFCSGEFAVSKRNTVGLFLKNTRKGVSRGSSINDVFQFEGQSSLPPDSEKKEFLGKGYSRLIAGGLIWKFSPFSIFNATTELSLDSKNEIRLHVWGGFVF
jgi:hypothetical protein